MTTLMTVVLVAVLAWRNLWAFRKVFAGLPGAQTGKSAVQAGVGAAFGVVRFVGALALMVGAWVALAAVAHGDEGLHNLGVPTFSMGFAVFNPVLVLPVGFIRAMD